MSRPKNPFSTIDYFAVAGPLTTAGVVNCIKGNLQKVSYWKIKYVLFRYCREDEYVNPIIFGLFSPELWTAVKGLFCKRNNNGKVIKVAIFHKTFK